MASNDTGRATTPRSQTPANTRRQRLITAMKETSFVTDTVLPEDELTRPDIKAERLGIRRAKDLHYLQRWRTEVPSVVISAKLHVQEVAEAHLADFEACSLYATQIDVVANKMLSDRAAYNRYLQAFDDYIAECTEWIGKEFTQLEKAAEGNLTESNRPVETAFRIGTHRGRQIHDCYVRADLALRYGTFALIFGMIEEAAYTQSKQRIVRALRRMKYNLRKVKTECFEEIAAQNKKVLFTASADTVAHEERLDPHADINGSIVAELAVVKPRPPRRRKTRA